MRVCGTGVAVGGLATVGRGATVGATGGALDCCTTGGWVGGMAVGTATVGTRGGMTTGALVAAGAGGTDVAVGCGTTGARVAGTAAVASGVLDCATTAPRAIVGEEVALVIVDAAPTDAVAVAAGAVASDGGTGVTGAVAFTEGSTADDTDMDTGAGIDVASLPDEASVEKAAASSAMVAVAPTGFVASCAAVCAGVPACLPMIAVSATSVVAPDAINRRFQARFRWCIGGVC